MSEQIKDGGPAFPIPGLSNDEDFNGMTLRDYFAAKALQGLLSCDAVDATKEAFASNAYEMADVMLRAREAKS